MQFAPPREELHQINDLFSVRKASFAQGQVDDLLKYRAVSCFLASHSLTATNHR